MPRLVYATLKHIPVEELWPMNGSTAELVEQYSKLLDELPPALAWKYGNSEITDGTKYHLIDGCNRHAAFVSKGRKVMPVYVISRAAHRYLSRVLDDKHTWDCDQYIVITPRHYHGPLLTYHEAGLRTLDASRHTSTVWEEAS